ncbi:MAG: hypothetical protein U0V74_17570 [Chitinophagales bacterium]
MVIRCLCVPCNAQPNAERPFSGALTGSCSQYMDVLANDGLDSRLALPS